MMNLTWILFLLSIVALPEVVSEEKTELPPPPLLRDNKPLVAKPREKETLIVGARKRTI